MGGYAKIFGLPGPNSKKKVCVLDALAVGGWRSIYLLKIKHFFDRFFFLFGGGRFFFLNFFSVSLRADAICWLLFYYFLKYIDCRDSPTHKTYLIDVGVLDDLLYPEQNRENKRLHFLGIIGGGTSKDLRQFEGMGGVHRLNYFLGVGRHISGPNRVFLFFLNPATTPGPRTSV